jgi:hypothetical protein
MLGNMVTLDPAHAVEVSHQGRGNPWGQWGLRIKKISRTATIDQIFFKSFLQKKIQMTSAGPPGYRGLDLKFNHREDAWWAYY